MRVWDNGTEFIEGVIQVVHPTSFSGIDVKSNAFPLSSGLSFWWTIKPRSARSGIAKMVNQYQLKV